MRTAGSVDISSISPGGTIYLMETGHISFTCEFRRNVLTKLGTETLCCLHIVCSRHGPSFHSPFVNILVTYCGMGCRKICVGRCSRNYFIMDIFIIIYVSLISIINIEES